MQGQIKKLSEDNEVLRGKVDRLKKEKEKLISNHRSSKSSQFSLSKNFMSGHASPMHTERGERKNSAAITKLATFKTRNDYNNSNYASAMTDRSNSSNQFLMSSMTLPKKTSNVFAEKTNTSII